LPSPRGMTRLLLLVALLALGERAPAVERRSCPPGINDTPAMPVHFEQADILRMPFTQVVALGQRIFVTDFNACDGGGRPGTTGSVTPRTPRAAFQLWPADGASGLPRRCQARTPSVTRS
jgi:hypothetical protein